MTNRCKFGIGNGKFAQSDMDTASVASSWQELPRFEAADGSESEHSKPAPKVQMWERPSGYSFREGRTASITFRELVLAMLLSRCHGDRMR